MRMRTILLLGAVAIATQTSSAAEKCSDIINMELAKFGKGTLDRPVGLDKLPGKNATNSFIQLKDPSGFGLVVHMDEKNSNQIKSYFITGSKFGAGTAKTGQFQDYVELDSNCQVLRYTKGTRFDDGKGNIEIKNDFEITSNVCRNIYPEALVENSNLFCQKDKLNSFISTNGGKAARLDSHAVATILKTCFQMPFSPTQQGVPPFSGTYPSQKKGSVPAK